MKNTKDEKRFSNLDCYKINSFLVDGDVREIFTKFSSYSKNELEKTNFVAKIAGRIMRIRNFGKIIFFLLRTFSGDIQIVFFGTKIAKNTGIGDIVGVEGVVFKTEKGELSIKGTQFSLLSKCLEDFPDIHYGFKDIEDRFRNRHIDFIVNKENKKILVERARIIKSIRNFLDEKKFLEVETPVLVSEASGAQAKPFVTHHNKLNSAFNLRIATEIPLKTLIVSGFEKIYEIGKVFRNEGIDARHNPEFTTIEIYEAYKNSLDMMRLTESLIKRVSGDFPEKECSFIYGKETINLKSPFFKMTMSESILKFSGVDFSEIKDFEQAKDIARRNGIFVDTYHSSVGHVMSLFFENFVERKLIQPTFIYNYPIETSPLAKSLPGDQSFADRFELFISGIEFANGYSELNDPYEQRRRFENQAKEKLMGNEEVADFDSKFIESLRFAMPPTGGLGIGIDRLVMLMTNKLNIKEVIAFPQMKKKNY